MSRPLNPLIFVLAVVLGVVWTGVAPGVGYAGSGVPAGGGHAYDALPATTTGAATTRVGVFRGCDDSANASRSRTPSIAAGYAAKGGLSRFGSLTHAPEGIRPYSLQTRVTAGRSGDIQAHHLIEKRFADVMGGNPNRWASIVTTRAEHQAFTNAWREAIAYGAGTRAATRAQVESAARRIYADYPEILRALGLP